MNNKKYLNILFFAFFAFIIHLFLYYFVSWYNNFFKNIKYENTQYVDKDSNLEEKKPNLEAEKLSSTTQSVDKSQKIITWSSSKFLIPDINNSSNSIDLSKNDEIWNKSNVEINLSSVKTKSSNLSSNQKYVLNLFSKYALTQGKIDNKNIIFWLTDEYPYKYIEYNTNDKRFSFYIFTEKKYDEILNVFDVISYNLYYKIKKVNNFWNLSFYMNLDEDYNDDYIRFIFSYKNDVFWLKLKKDLYNEIKFILQSNL